MDGVNITTVRLARQAAGHRRGQARRDARLATRRAGTARQASPSARPIGSAGAVHPGGKPAAPPGPTATNWAERHPFVIGAGRPGRRCPARRSRALRTELPDDAVVAVGDEDGRAVHGHWVTLQSGPRPGPPATVVMTPGPAAIAGTPGPAATPASVIGTA